MVPVVFLIIQTSFSSAKGVNVGRLPDRGKLFMLSYQLYSIMISNRKLRGFGLKDILDLQNHLIKDLDEYIYKLEYVCIIMTRI